MLPKERHNQFPRWQGGPASQPLSPAWADLTREPPTSTASGPGHPRPWACAAHLGARAGTVPPLHHPQRCWLPPRVCRAPPWQPRHSLGPYARVYRVGRELLRRHEPALAHEGVALGAVEGGVARCGAPPVCLLGRGKGGRAGSGGRAERGGRAGAGRRSKAISDALLAGVIACRQAGGRERRERLHEEGDAAARARKRADGGGASHQVSPLPFPTGCRTPTPSSPCAPNLPAPGAHTSTPPPTSRVRRWAGETRHAVADTIDRPPFQPACTP